MKRVILRSLVPLALIGLIVYQFYRWPSAAAETDFMLRCEEDYATESGTRDFRVKYASATSGRFGKWQVSLVVERIPDVPPERRIYCIYDRNGLRHLQDVRAGLVYNRESLE